MDPEERREGRAQTEHVPERRDPNCRLFYWRHVAGQRPDYVSAKFADNVVDLGGLGPFDAVTRASLWPQARFVNAHVAELQEGSPAGRGERPRDDVPDDSTASRAEGRQDAFASWRARETERASHRLLSPELTSSRNFCFFRQGTTCAGGRPRRR